MNIFKVHGVTFERTGKCKRCGQCEKKDCPHFSIKNGLATCDIYNKRNEVCKSCSSNEKGIWWRKGNPITHAVCKKFPNHPFLRVIMEGICGYKFKPLTKKDEIKYKKLVEAWK